MLPDPMMAALIFLDISFLLASARIGSGEADRGRSDPSHLEPHRIPYYLNDLVATFHSYYNQNRIIGDDAELTQARLFLAAATRIVLRNALNLLGVSAPERM